MKVYPSTLRGKPVWVLDFGTVHGQRRRKYFATDVAANREKDKAEKDSALAGRWWASVSARDKHEMISTFKEMNDSGLHPSDVWQAYLHGEDTVKERRTLKAAIEETILAKREANRKESSIKALESYLTKFARGRESLAVDRVKPADIEQWFSGRNEAPTTRQSNMGRLSSMFSLCLRRGYIRTNPCDAIDPVIVDQKPPVILSVAECKRMLTLCEKRFPALLPYIVLCLLAGCRPEEVQNMDWKAVDLKRKRLTINYDTTKVRRWRIVDLPKPAIFWIGKCQRKGPPYNADGGTARRKLSGRVSPAFTTLRRLRRALRDELGMEKWTADILRHTAASHLLAYHQDAQKVALMLGTSPKMLFRHYRKLVTYEDGKKFVELR